jgi:hypothetical protein
MAFEVHERAAAVTGIDSGVGLDPILHIKETVLSGTAACF